MKSCLQITILHYIRTLCLFITKIIQIVCSPHLLFLPLQLYCKYVNMLFFLHVPRVPWFWVKINWTELISSIMNLHELYKVKSRIFTYTIGCDTNPLIRILCIQWPAKCDPERVVTLFTQVIVILTTIC